MARTRSRGDAFAVRRPAERARDVVVRFRAVEGLPRLRFDVDLRAAMCVKVARDVDRWTWDAVARRVAPAPARLIRR